MKYDEMITYWKERISHLENETYYRQLDPQLYGQVYTEAIDVMTQTIEALNRLKDLEQ